MSPWRLSIRTCPAKHSLASLLNAFSESSLPGLCLRVCHCTAARRAELIAPREIFRIWSRKSSRDYTLRMSGLYGFVAYDKPDFTGRDAALRDRGTHARQTPRGAGDGSPEADVAEYELIWFGKDILACGSGGGGHCAGMSLPMG
jgi:glycine cleavage system aminomethyltransferase T